MPEYCRDAILPIDLDIKLGRQSLLRSDSIFVVDAVRDKRNFTPGRPAIYRREPIFASDLRSFGKVGLNLQLGRS